MAKRKSADGDGCLYRRKRNGKPYGSYLIKYRENGKRYTHNLNTDDFSEAKHLWHQWVLDRQTGKTGIRRDDMEVTAWFAEYLEYRRMEATEKKSIKSSTYQKYEDVANNFSEFIRHEYPGLQMRELTSRHFDKYMSWRSKRTRYNNKSRVPITKRGINKEIDFLATIFKRAAKLSIIRNNPVTEVIRFRDAHEQDDPVIWSFDQVAAILQATTPIEAQRAATFVAMTGCRRAEMEHVRWKDVDFNENFVVIGGDKKTEWTPKTKNGYRKIPMAKTLRDMLMEMKEELGKARDGDAVFLLPDGRPMYKWVDYPLRHFQNAIKRLQKKGQKIGMGSLRTLRHWFISYAINREDNPLSLLEVQRIVGHGDLSMIEKVYYHPDNSKVQRKMDSFGQGFSVGQQPQAGL